MKKAALTFFLLISILSLPRTLHAQTPVVSGGELIYVHISDSTYQYFAKLYYECSSSSRLDSIPLCFEDTCNSASFSVHMKPFGNTDTLSPGCSNAQTTCNNVTATIPGYEEFFYSAIVTMPARCNSWRIFTYVPNRKASYNIANSSSQLLYLEVRMNNTITHNNSSPFYSVRPVNYTILNKNYTYNAGVLDADGDSLYTTIIMPRSGVGSCSDTPVVSSFNSTTPPYNRVSNPIQTNNTFNLNSNNGQMNFTPAQTGDGTIALKTEEYRNGVHIGSVMREMQVHTQQVNNQPTVSTGSCTGGNFPGQQSGKVYGCVGQNLSFCFYAKSSDPNGNISLSDNFSTTLPGANISYINQGTDSVAGLFSWTPTTNHAGNYSTLVLIRDSTCNFPGIPLQYARAIDFTIWGKLDAGPDTSICGNNPAYLYVNGGGIYQWTVLPGGDSNSLSNPNIANPVATPTKTTTYVVTSTINPYCPNKDTVTVTVNTPSVNISVAPANTINLGDTVTFTATTYNCTNPAYQWMVDGVPVFGATQYIYHTSTLFDKQDVTCKISCTDSCAALNGGVSNTITMQVTTPQNSINNAAGGELLYVHVSGSTYQYFFKFYRDCFGVAEPDSVPLCLHNPCTNTTMSLQMGKYTGTTPPSGQSNCPNYETVCDNPSSTIPGYSEHWYTALVNLPARCSSWRAFTHVPNRNYSYNLQNSTNNSLFAEAMLNNSVTYNNSSPFYSVRPIIYLQKGRTYNYNNGALDADGDSLVSELIAPQSGTPNCQYAPSPIPFSNTSPAFNLINNPFSTGNTFTLNTKNGRMDFTARTLGKANLAIRTKEYRNGILMGSVTREIQTLTLDKTSDGSTLSRNYGCTSMNITGDTIHACPGQNVSFCFSTVSSDKQALLTLTDNLQNAIPNASITYSNQGTDSVNATFSWTPTRNDIGHHSAFIFMTDSACHPPGYIFLQAEKLNIHVWGAVSTIDDTTICPGTSAQLTTTGGANYEWDILPGGTRNSLSDTTSADPLASPTVTTSYVVTSGIAPYCPNTKDTVEVSLYPASSVTSPRISISSSPGNYVPPGDTITFTANVSGCTSAEYQWLVNGNLIIGATQGTYSTAIWADKDVVTCRLICGDICATNSDTISNAITIRTNSVSVKNISNGFIDLYPNPNNGHFTIDLAKQVEGESVIEVLNSVGQVVYTRKILTLKIEQLILPAISSGVYMLRVVSGSEVGTIRFVVD